MKKFLSLTILFLCNFSFAQPMEDEFSDLQAFYSTPFAQTIKQTFIKTLSKEKDNFFGEEIKTMIIKLSKDPYSYSENRQQTSEMLKEFYKEFLAVIELFRDFSLAQCYCPSYKEAKLSSPKYFQNSLDKLPELFNTVETEIFEKNFYTNILEKIPSEDDLPFYLNIKMFDLIQTFAQSILREIQQ